MIGRSSQENVFHFEQRIGERAAIAGDAGLHLQVVEETGTLVCQIGCNDQVERADAVVVSQTVAVAIAAEQQIAATAALQCIIAIAANENVIPIAAIDRIVAIAGRDEIMAIRPGNGIAAPIADKRVDDRQSAPTGTVAALQRIIAGRDEITPARPRSGIAALLAGTAIGRTIGERYVPAAQREEIPLECPRIADAVMEACQLRELVGANLAEPKEFAKRRQDTFATLREISLLELSEVDGFDRITKSLFPTIERRVEHEYIVRLVMLEDTLLDPAV